MARYGLARHVFVCVDEEYIVILDVRQDRYFTFEAAKTAALAGEVPGWPVSASESGVPSSVVDEVAAPLRTRGWLLEASGESKDATPVRNTTPAAELAEGGESRSPRLSIGLWFSFVAASLFAKLALRFWRFERVIKRVARRRARHAGVGRPLDVERARQLFYAFGRMRVFLFSTRDECLHDSLAVIEFLARYGLYPNWVFGVRARPFEAHCWVQHAGVVFNDTVEQVGAYAPIMIV